MLRGDFIDYFDLDQTSISKVERRILSGVALNIVKETNFSAPLTGENFDFSGKGSGRPGLGPDCGDRNLKSLQLQAF
ncbi:MAG: hypothetical protein ACAH10_10045 [Methylophilaceae bacterium]